MQDKPSQTAAGSAGHAVPHEYENVDPKIVQVLEKVRTLFADRDQFPDGVPGGIEITSGVARERLTLGKGVDEVFMVKKKNRPGDAKPKRKIEIDIMSEADAKKEVEGGGGGPKGAPAVIDPCCWWEWNGVRWVCVGYGD